MKLSVINTGFFKLDGGAMFGVVPKSIWQKTNPADEQNLCTWAMRCLLVEVDKQLMLIDNGIGDKQDSKFFSHYHLSGSDSLVSSIRQAGYDTNEITDMFLTHLHFDHCGGGVRRKETGFEMVFHHARYWTNDEHWRWATEPNPREAASFLRDNILPMEESGHLHRLQKGQTPLAGVEIFYASGHTDKMMVPMIRYKEHTICFMADLLPSVGHIPLPYVMGYDTRPLLTLEEKKSFLHEAADRGYVLFFEHDPVNECCTVKHTEKGVRLDRTFPLREIL
ncbi:MAG: MBL fold metallo-hydrolase [Cyclobacteriaceae bacterium]|nr:MBL fold metallo-hydrolase [Cyclobacteriaceae bacterium]